MNSNEYTRVWTSLNELVDKLNEFNRMNEGENWNEERSGHLAAIPCPAACRQCWWQNCRGSRAASTARRNWSPWPCCTWNRRTSPTSRWGCPGWRRWRTACHCCSWPCCSRCWTGCWSVSLAPQPRGCRRRTAQTDFPLKRHSQSSEWIRRHLNEMEWKQSNASRVGRRIGPGHCYQ